MREDLNAFGNELNYYNVACECHPIGHFTDSQTTLLVSVQCLDNFDLRLTTLKDVLGQVPLMTLQTKKKM